MVPVEQLHLPETLEVKVARLEAHFKHGRESLNELKDGMKGLVIAVDEIKNLLFQNAIVRAETNAEVKALRTDLNHHMREETGELEGLKGEIRRLVNSIAGIQIICPHHDSRIRKLEVKHNGT